MNVLDLFSGIGGFSLGLERAGMRTVAFCEIEPYCRAILRKHWPNVPVYEDVRELGGQIIKADVICGGFPCQDISLCGDNAGIDGERSGLWREYARLIREIRPRYVIVENVAALAVRGLERVLGDLASLRYDARWDCIPASTIGALHDRDRLWIVAYSDTERCRCPQKQLARYGEMLRKGLSAAAKLQVRGYMQDECFLKTLGLPDGVPADLDAIGALGNAVVPQIPEIIGRAIMQAEGLSTP